MANQGWRFTLGDFYYFVAAPSKEAAREIVAEKDAAAAKTEPDRIPDELVAFLGIGGGRVATAGVFQRWTVGLRSHD